MFGLERVRGHSAVAHLMQLASDLIEHPLPIRLCAKTAISVAMTQLFQLVVQVAHVCISYLVSVFDQPQARSLTGSAKAERSRDTTPVRLEMPGRRQGSFSSGEDGTTKSNELNN